MSRRHLKLWATFSVLWCIGAAVIAVHQWYDVQYSRTYLGRAECRPENPKPPAWCYSAPPAVQDFSARPFVLAALAFPAVAFIAFYIAGLAGSRSRR